ncbi:MAG: alkaline phosphatase D family protein, partial [Pyrinomonadaceae bacterium]
QLDGAADATGHHDHITGLAVLRACYRHAEKHPAQKILIVGHTDRSGKDPYNLTLSQMRADNVLYALAGEREKWAKLSEKKHKVRDYQLILKWVARERGWGCDPGEVDDDLGPKTRAAIRKFQKLYNDEAEADIAVDGIVGVETWGAFFDLYVDKLMVMLKTDEAGLDTLRRKLKFIEQGRKTVGCGENYPIEEARRDEYRSQINRRVEILFFDPGEEPQMGCHPEPGKCDADKCEIYNPRMYTFEHIPVEPDTPARRFFIKVVDEYDHPLWSEEGEKYVLHQNGKKDEGELDAEGRAFFFNVSEREPFRLEVRGRVCAITEGAFLLPEQLDKRVAEGGIEYGGTFPFDWAWADDDAGLADGKPRSELFWEEYESVRKGFMGSRVQQATAAVEAADEKSGDQRQEALDANQRHEEARRKYEQALEKYDFAWARRRESPEEYETARKNRDLAQKEYDLTGEELDKALAEGERALKQEINVLEEHQHMLGGGGGRTLMGLGPSTFWQHEHITRRDIRIRKKYLDEFPEVVAVIKATPVQVRVGPLVRYTRHDAAVVWVELETPGLVRVKVGEKEPQEKIHHGATVRVGGRHFAAVPVYGLVPDTAYQYTLELVPLPAVGNIPVEGEFTDEVFPYKLHPKILADFKRQLRPCAFPGSEWLRFRTLRKAYGDRLRFAYGSCRKSGGSGIDAMKHLWSAMHRTTDTGDWPSFLLLIGDQIYADDIETNQAKAIQSQRVAWRKPGPAGGDALSPGAWAGRFASRFTPFSESYQGKASEYATNPLYGLSKNWLFNIPVNKNDQRVAAGDGYAGIHAADFAEYAFLYETAWGTETVEQEFIRRVLANVPSFMIFDDHEVTDDWNFDQEWSDMAHKGKDFSEWPATIGDGLAAYWMYQGWGNQDPSQWKQDERTKVLLEARRQGTDALADLRGCLRKEVRPPQETTETGRLKWYYKLPVSPSFLVLDGRTQRVLKAKARDSVVMTDDQFDWLRTELKQADRSGQAGAFVVAADPVVLPAALALGMSAHRRDEPGLQDEIARLVLNRGELRGRDIEHWMADASWGKIKEVFKSLGQNRKALKTVVFLSGDVHFSFNMVATLAGDGPAFPELLQLVCSPIQKRLGEGTQGKARKIIEPNRDAIDDLRTGAKMAFFRWLATPMSFDSEFDGMKMSLAGFRGHSNPASTVIMENSVAVVDGWLTSPGDQNYRPGELVVREQYLMNSAAPLERLEDRPPHRPFMFNPPVPGKTPPAGDFIEFWYQSVKGGSVMTRAPVR